jgi:hypothetical protein
MHGYDMDMIRERPVNESVRFLRGTVLMAKAYKMKDVGGQREHPAGLLYGGWHAKQGKRDK